MMVEKDKKTELVNDIVYFLQTDFNYLLKFGMNIYDEKHKGSSLADRQKAEKFTKEAILEAFEIVINANRNPIAERLN